MGATMANPDLRHKIKVRMRPDLTITKQRYGGQTFYIIKDPVGLRYYRFREEELFLLQQFDGNHTLDDIRHRFVERFRPQRISVTELEKFVQQALQAGIATADTPQLGQRLFERYQKKQRDKIKQLALNILYIKIPIFDPERILTRLVAYTSFLFSVPFLLLMVLLWSAAGLLVLINWDTFVSKLPSYQEFFTWRNLLYFWCTLAVVKVLHEFGHGVSCKKFGGEVHEMGFLILVLTPCLYCNVTDAWMLPNKWHRAAIGAAGIYIELILSALFVWVWWYTEPGLLNTLALSIIFICSVSTVVFNANPLLRFDGYYILADLMEVPNLRERSNKYLGNVTCKVFFGSEAVADPYAPKRYRSFFVFYAIAAYIYRWVITIGILWFLYTFLKPYKLAMISAMLATAAAVTLIVVPIHRITKTLKNRWRSMKVDKVRMATSLATAAVVLAALLFIPWPMWIDAPMILLPKDAVSIFVQLPGTLEDLYVKDGDAVPPGTLLARLDDPELRKQLDLLRLEHEQHRRAELAFRAMNDSKQSRAHAVRANAAGQQLRKLYEKVQQLDVIVPAHAQGTVFSPPKEEDLGTTYKPGQLFCQIGDPKSLEAFIVVEHSDIELIKSGPNQPAKTVWLKLTGHVGDILQGQVGEIASTPLEEIPPALSNKMGGEVATSTDPERKLEIPVFKSYNVQVDVPNPEGTLVPGVRGIARIDIGWRSIFWRLKRYLQQTFHFRM